jgi:hypothetical protein
VQLAEHEVVVGFRAMAAKAGLRAGIASGKGLEQVEDDHGALRYPSGQATGSAASTPAAARAAATQVEERIMANTPLKAIAAVLLLAWAGATVAAEDEAIRAAALDYAEGWYMGDATRMEQALHPEFLKRRVVIDIGTEEPSLHEIDAPTMLRATQAGVGKGAWQGPLDLTVTILDQHDDMAAVRVVSPLYVDYLQLVKWRDHWVILDVLWGALATPED